jgi:hypothetical protein
MELGCPVLNGRLKILSALSALAASVFGFV